MNTISVNLTKQENTRIATYGLQKWDTRIFHIFPYHFNLIFRGACKTTFLSNTFRKIIVHRYQAESLRMSCTNFPERYKREGWNSL